MEIQELNNLLKPYKIAFECGKCESTARNPFQNRCLNQKVELTAKKIKKTFKVKKVYNESSQIKQKMINRKCRTERKPVTNENWISKNYSPISVNRTKDNQALRHSNFFMELKLSNDKFLNCPQFENHSNLLSLKNPGFGYEATASTINTDSDKNRLPFGDIGDLRKNLFDLDHEPIDIELEKKD